MKVDSFSESTDKSVLSSNRQSFYFPECENLNFSDYILVTESCLEIENVIKFDILEACKVKKAVSKSQKKF